MAKFAAGPWTIVWRHVDVGGFQQALIVADDAGVALVYTGGEGIHHAEKGEAHARLIAAAPEMYELLRRCARQLDADYPLDATHIMGVLARIDGDSDG